MMTSVSACTCLDGLNRLIICSMFKDILRERERVNVGISYVGRLQTFAIIYHCMTLGYVREC